MGDSRRNILVIVVQSLSRVQLFSTPWTAARQAFLSFTISWSLLKFMSIEWMMPSNHLSSVAPISSCPPSFQASEHWVLKLKSNFKNRKMKNEPSSTAGGIVKWCSQCRKELGGSLIS